MAGSAIEALANEENNAMPMKESLCFAMDETLEHPVTLEHRVCDREPDAFGTRRVLCEETLWFEGAALTVTRKKDNAPTGLLLEPADLGKLPFRLEVAPEGFCVRYSSFYSHHRGSVTTHVTLLIDSAAKTAVLDSVTDVDVD